MYDRALNTHLVITTQKMKFSIIDFFSKCDQIRNFLRSWSYLPKKSLMENFIFCAVNSKGYSRYFADHIKQREWNGILSLPTYASWLMLQKHRITAWRRTFPLFYFHLKNILKICNTRKSSLVWSHFTDIICLSFI